MDQHIVDVELVVTIGCHTVAVAVPDAKHGTNTLRRAVVERCKLTVGASARCVNFIAAAVGNFPGYFVKVLIGINDESNAVLSGSTLGRGLLVQSKK